MVFVTANIFQPLIDVFQSVMIFFHDHVGVSWGFSIVLLTICVRAVMIPLTLKQFKSMRALQTLQPELKAIQNKYKDDKQRQQQELMKFYKENKVNPLGSCLPLVAQLPVFISLFYMLRKSLRGDICPQIQAAYKAVHGAAATTPCGPHGGAGFLFIPDLTNKATGGVLVVLILLYVGTQLASSLMMSSPTMDQTQRKIMLFMPLVFVFFVINFPAGVLVYWITTNTWTIGQQYIVKRRIGPVALAAAPSDGGGGAGGGGSGGAGAGGSGSGDGPRGSRAKSPGAGSGGSKAAAGTAPAPAGIGALLRSKVKPKEAAAAAAVAGAPADKASGPPPRPPRKKKKRSGRRR
jgi:YidC/Oxa1 family membrane protein insertase